jgi:hypothetical protein
LISRFLILFCGGSGRELLSWDMRGDAMRKAMVIVLIAELLIAAAIAQAVAQAGAKQKAKGGIP